MQHLEVVMEGGAGFHISEDGDARWNRPAPRPASPGGCGDRVAYLVALAHTLADGIDGLPDDRFDLVDVRLARALAMNIIDVLDPRQPR